MSDTDPRPEVAPTHVPYARGGVIAGPADLAALEACTHFPIAAPFVVGTPEVLGFPDAPRLVLPEWKMEEARVALGRELPELGPNGVRIIQGEALAFLRSLPSNSVDMVATDGPYSSGGAHRSDRAKPPERKYASTDTTFADEAFTFAGDGRDQHAFVMWAIQWTTECHRVLKDGGLFVTFSDWRQMSPTTDYLQAGGIIWRGTGVWAKGSQGARPRHGAFRQEAEFFPWGTKGQLPEGWREGEKWPGCYGRGFILCDLPDHERFHLTSKPTKVMEEIIAVTRPGSLIVDPFAGAGTTLLAALRLGRRALGCELVPGYVERARARIAEEAKGLPPLRVSGGQVVRDEVRPLFDEPKPEKMCHTGEHTSAECPGDHGK